MNILHFKQNIFQQNNNSSNEIRIISKQHKAVFS